MSISIKQVDVIDDSLNFINLLSVRSEASGTKDWTSGKNTVNIADGLLYGPGHPSQVTPLYTAGDIIVDGSLIISDLSKLVYALD